MQRSVPIGPSGVKPEALSVADAAKALGVSGRTIKRMIAAGELSAFRTRGGHLRIAIESVKAVKGESLRAVSNPSAVLQNRRERVEELNLEAQELRAERQLEDLRREQKEKESDRRAEAETLRQDQKDRARALVVDRQRIKRQETEEHERHRAAEEAQSRKERFVSSWLEVGLALIPDGAPAKARLDGASKLKDFLQECHPTNEMQLLRMVTATVSEALAPWRREQEVAAILEDARQLLPYAAREEWWELKAKQAALSAIDDLGDSASMEQIRTAAILAIKPVVVEYEAQQRAERVERQKANYLDHWFLYFQLSSYVHHLLTHEVIELEAGETNDDVVSALEPVARRHLNQHLTGMETRSEVLALLHDSVREEFNL